MGISRNTGIAIVVVLGVIALFALMISPISFFSITSKEGQANGQAVGETCSVDLSLGEKDMDERRTAFLEERDSMVMEMHNEGKYRCCLEKPCTYCIEKTPKHGEGATCDCLADVVEGVHPCGECIGEILEGHGNPYLANYFANAIAEEVGKEHEETLRQIISEKYDISLDEQDDF